MELGDAPSTWLEGAVVTSRLVGGMPGPADAHSARRTPARAGQASTE
jgi:hypothetical protein